MTLEESDALTRDRTFQGRVKIAALKYAQYLALQAGNSSGRTNWIQSTMRSPDQAAQLLTPLAVMNPNVQTFGADVDDPNLMAAVQAVADMMM